MYFEAQWSRREVYFEAHMVEEKCILKRTWSRRKVYFEAHMVEE